VISESYVYAAYGKVPLVSALFFGLLRADVLAYARSQAKQQPGIFALTVPTGSGHREDREVSLRPQPSEKPEEAIV
jgi:hypothetical protein